MDGANRDDGKSTGGQVSVRGTTASEGVFKLADLGNLVRSDNAAMPLGQLDEPTCVCSRFEPFTGYWGVRVVRETPFPRSLLHRCDGNAAGFSLWSTDCVCRPSE